MYFNIPETKDVLIKNLIGERLKGYIFKLWGIEKHPLKISNIRKNGQ